MQAGRSAFGTTLCARGDALAGDCSASATTLQAIRVGQADLDAQIVAMRVQQADLRAKRQALQIVWDATLSAMLATDKPGSDVFAPSPVAAPVVASPAPVVAPIDKPTTKPRK